MCEWGLKMFSIYTLFEICPRNPDQIILINQYYLNGISKLDIYNYYITNKDKILEFASGREVLIFSSNDRRELFVRRNIILNKMNYNDVITGRTISLHCCMKQKEKFGIIDIDCDDFNKSKDTVKLIYNLLKNKFKLTAYFTGKSSFHIHVNYDKLFEINKIREFLLSELNDLNLDNDKYLINKKRSNGKVNLDLSSNKFRGAFICPNALSFYGLIAKPININELDIFDINSCKIK